MAAFLKLFRKNVQPEKQDEEKRLDDLYAYGILDTAREEDFEELVALAAQVSGCPIATISFVDRNRQWFKASKGLEVSETPREISFCTHTLLEEGAMIIEDARQDERFAANPVVTGDMQIIFYAGTPIISTNGHKLGTVCVIDHKKRTFSDEQLAALKIIAKQVTHLLDLRLQNKILQERSQNLVSENEKSFDAYFANDVLPKWIYEIGTLRILQVNDASIGKYGFTKEEFLNSTVFDFRDDKEPLHIHQLVQSLNTGESSVRFETRHKKKDGTYLPVEVLLSNITYKGTPARLATMYDLTQKELLLQQLRADKKKMESKVYEAAHSAREQERNYIGKELHDNINQVLASTKLYLELATSATDMKDDLIKLSQKNVELAMKEIRHLSKSLVAHNEDFNLVKALEELINSYLVSNQFTIAFSGTENIEDVPADLKITIFRIIQEALNNVSKHAEASSVSLDISYTDHIAICIKDNGKGFDTGDDSGGIGLKNIENRVQFYNGSLQINSANGKGCTLYVEIPMDVVAY